MRNRKPLCVQPYVPHTRESREVIQPLIQQSLSESEMNENIKNILLGDGKGIW